MRKEELKLVSKLVNLLDGKKLVIAIVVCLLLVMIDFAMSLVLVTTFGSFGPPYYNPLLNLSILNPTLYSVVFALSFLEAFLICLECVIFGLLIFVFAVVIKRDRDVSCSKK
jgi:uncharacterized membrane protein